MAIPAIGFTTRFVAHAQLMDYERLRILQRAPAIGAGRYTLNNLA
jgi:hypothetical protein